MTAPAPQTWAWSDPEPEPTPGWEFETLQEFGSPGYRRVYTRPVIQHTEPASVDPLAALRSEVQRMRDEADTSYQAARKNHEGWWNTTGLFAQQQRHEAWSRMCQLGANRDAYRALLDLIDKHAREGQ